TTRTTWAATVVAAPASSTPAIGVTRATMPASAPRRRRRPAFDSTRPLFTRTGASRCSIAQGPVEKGRHLTTTHEIVRAEPIDRRGITTTSHTRRGKTIDVTLEDASVVVDELVAATAVRVSQRADQERRHLTTSHEIVRAEPIVRRGIAATSD